ncbi:MAG: class F sortase [Anaerolineaceae bacterium]|nr:class F sortase [Anaerolineaceae bacterium]
MKKKFFNFLYLPLLLSILILVIFGIVQAGAGGIDPTDKWAWGTNIGWINFAPTHGSVTAYDDHLEGYVWGENIGWIRLGSYARGSSHTYANDAADTYGVNHNGSGVLSGYAWGTNVGWINFNPTHGGVTINPSTGSFDGYAWGENIGWVHFKGTEGNTYNVVTTYRPESINPETLPAIVNPETLPATGFPMGRVTVLSAQPESKAYRTTEITLEIPALSVEAPIVGVPVSQDGWDLTWLGDQAGWLHGTAFPSWAGNSAITAHVVDANGQPGLFNNLSKLKWGDEVIVHVYGQAYVYEVRTVEKYTKPDDTSSVYKHEEYPWLTLITCQGFDEESDSYNWRVMVRAVQTRIY